MSNNIEEGCLAIVVNAMVPENLGKVVRVGNFLGEIVGFYGKRRWEVDTPLLFMCGSPYCHASEENLMCIDNLPEEDKIIEKELDLNLN